MTLARSSELSTLKLEPYLVRLLPCDTRRPVKWHQEYGVFISKSTTAEAVDSLDLSLVSRA
jgi:hypothetical protein